MDSLTYDAGISCALIHADFTALPQSSFGLFSAGPKSRRATPPVRCISGWEGNGLE
jgi:hypothetical protein